MSHNETAETSAEATSSSPGDKPPIMPDTTTASTTTASTKDAEATTASLAPLRRGDLVRISESGRRFKRLKDRAGEMGRIVKIEHQDDPEEALYEVEWILGGRLPAVRRQDLTRTTADAEGMTEESTRQRRKRSLPESTIEPVALKTKPAPKKAATKKPKVKTAKSSSQSTKKATTTAKGGKKRKRTEPPAAPTAQVENAGTELYQRQNREFERMLTRLEKLDKFGFFLDDVPDEFQEDYFGAPKSGTSPSANGEATSVAPHDKPSTNQAPVFPKTAPYNWLVIRRRLELGRYITDREREEEDERFRSFADYYKTLNRKKRPKRHRVFPDKPNPRVLTKKGVDWAAFRDDVVAMCDAAIARDEDDTEGQHGSVAYAAKKIKEETIKIFERTGRRQMAELAAADDRYKFATAIEKHGNTEAAMQSWRKSPFPERKYERLSSDVVCAGLSAVDERIATYELRTNLPDSFIGLSYRYDDTGQSEAWMKSVVDETGFLAQQERGKSSTSRKNAVRQAAAAMASDEGVIRAQVAASMQNLLIAVQDRVLTETHVLEQPELRSANWIEDSRDEFPSDEPIADVSVEAALDSEEQKPEVVEQPVWGIDCYTRRNICVCLETEFDSETALLFVEKWLLPAINACPSDLGHEISNATRLLEGLPFESSDGEEDIEAKQEQHIAWKHAPLRSALMEKIQTSAPTWLKPAANQLRRARAVLGPDFFRVHPKGHGSIVLSQSVKPHTLVTFYRGELYPSWRWGEKMDAIELTQKRKDLKPALTDFYNMVLERPQSDPRGYGLLFVDASRKAGHGSSLSHSCAPTCEVRVAALNGTLCLAMTTLRELEMGEELTFDYNAVTESLNEYRSAVCLCGYSKCRGSFLHFATADCYQQVMNRNSPIASRFSNLVKGSMKQVMAEDDERVLSSHGFLTAAFGAISVNRRQGAHEDGLEDSIDFVPIWLRTFVADTLRYIEYERRALPISLICDNAAAASEVEEETDALASNAKEPQKPEPPFFYFARTQKDFLQSLLKKEGFPMNSVNGMQLKHAMQKVASGYWQALSDDKKQHWKTESRNDFEKRKKAWRTQAVKATKGSKSKPKNFSASFLSSSSMSFQDADAEGISAMEQRIQQLTQTLSRVGRVLDRHREYSFAQEEDIGSFNSTDAPSLRKRVHSPLSVAPDEEVVDWVWNRPDGVVGSLIAGARTAPFARLSLCERLEMLRKKYVGLVSFGEKPATAAQGEASARVSTSEGRRLLKDGLFEMRDMLLDEVKEMGKVNRQYRTLLRPKSLKEQQDEQSVRDGDAEIEAKGVGPLIVGESAPTSESSQELPGAIVSAVMEELIKSVEQRVMGDDHLQPKHDGAGDEEAVDDEAKARMLLEENPWLSHYRNRFALLAAADTLLMYAHTNNFFAMEPYSCLESTPIEVYARELGNTVPRSAMDRESNIEPTAAPLAVDLPISGAVTGENSTTTTSKLTTRDCPPVSNEDAVNASIASADRNASQPLAKVSVSVGELDVKNDLCEPDDIISNVTVGYSGDYVLSQLLQWYNGGIGLRPGLPDMLGCVALPDIGACFASELVASNKLKHDRKTTYEAKVRPLLVEWFQDPYRRGSPWSSEIQQAFVHCDNSRRTIDPLRSWRPLGSPIVDFLVTGDESSILAVLSELDADDRVGASSASDGLLLSVDKGRPAQAVCNWVQCESPDCMKWRKIPWHVDIDLLPEKFFCKDNKWNPDVARCEAPEEDWDEDDKLVGNDGKVEGSPVRKDKNASLSPSDEANFFIGARFDVQRQGNDDYTIGSVVKIDLSGKTKRIKFHFHRTSSDADEWVEFRSSRIAALFTKVPKGTAKAKGGPSKNGMSSNVGDRKAARELCAAIKDPPEVERAKEVSFAREGDGKKAKAGKKLSGNSNGINGAVSAVESGNGDKLGEVGALPKKKRKRVRKKDPPERQDGTKSADAPVQPASYDSRTPTDSQFSDPFPPRNGTVPAHDTGYLNSIEAAHRSLTGAGQASGASTVFGSDGAVSWSPESILTLLGSASAQQQQIFHTSPAQSASPQSPAPSSQASPNGSPLEQLLLLATASGALSQSYSAQNYGAYGAHPYTSGGYSPYPPPYQGPSPTYGHPPYSPPTYPYGYSYGPAPADDASAAAWQVLAAYLPPGNNSGPNGSNGGSGPYSNYRS